MKVKAAVAVLAAVLALGEGTAWAQGKPASSMKQFKYKSGKVEVGMLYTYIRSDLAGAKTGSVLVYVPDRKRIEILRVSPGTSGGELVTGELGTDILSLRQFEIWREARDGGKSRQASGTLTDNTLEVTVEDPALYRGAAGAATFSVPVTQLPVHLYGLDFVTLGMALRHLADPSTPVAVGVLTENTKVGPGSPNLIVPAGPVTVEYVEDVDRDGTPCSKYRLTGPLLGSEEGYLWLHKEKGHLQDAEIPAAPGPDWPDVKITLRSAEKVSEGDWPLRRRLEIAGSLKN